MNQRIETLAKAAGYDMINKAAMRALGFDVEKFAELIVEEMYAFMCDATDNDKPWPAFKEVKQHFGVEE